MVTYRQPISNGGHIFITGVYNYFDEMEVPNGLILDSYSLMDARVGYRHASDRWNAAVFVRNITDEVYFTNGVGQRAFTNVTDLVSGLGEPQTWGIDFNYSF